MQTVQMNLAFEVLRAASYVSPAQKIRILSEHWVSREAYCPNCGSGSVIRYGNNNPAADFFCERCRDAYELKSGKTRFAAKVVDGAYGTMMTKLRSDGNPHLLLLHYEVPCLEVRNFLVVPNHFFVPEIIERREPLAGTARRAGWIGCNILLQQIPDAGRIFVVKEKIVEPRPAVLAKWRRTLFLRDQTDFAAKGWLLDVIRCIERLGQRTFLLDELYAFEGDLSRTYPGNRHVKEKIRQQLQVLRDKGFLDFLGKGAYRLSAKPE